MAAHIPLLPSTFRQSLPSGHVEGDKGSRLPSITSSEFKRLEDVARVEYMQVNSGAG